MTERVTPQVPCREPRQLKRGGKERREHGSTSCAGDVESATGRTRYSARLSVFIARSVEAA